jgi:DNA-directed RNA polymerase subunit RPC12/RpoP
VHVFQHLEEVVRNRMEIKARCRECGHSARLDPGEVCNQVAYRMQSRRGRVIPDRTLRGAARIYRCSDCGAREPVFEAIRPATEVDD